MTTDVTTQSIIEKVKLRILPAVFVAVGVGFLAGALLLTFPNQPIANQVAADSTASSILTEPECRPTAQSDQAVSGMPSDSAITSIGPMPHAGCLYTPGQLIVKFKTDKAVSDVKAALTQNFFSLSSSQLKTVSQRLKLEKIDKVFTSIASPAQLKQKFPQRAQRAPINVTRPNLSRIYRLSFPADADIVALAKQYEQLADVEYAEPNYLVSLAVIPNDPYFSSTGSWGQTYADMWGLKRIKMEQAWGVTTGSSSVVVAVSDTGIDYNHPELQAQMWTNAGEIPSNGVDDDSNGFIDDARGWDFGNNDNDPIDRHGHGTHVAGTIGGTTNNSLGVAGINWNVKLMATKGFSDGVAGGSMDALANTVNYAVNNGADVINMSWGGGAATQTLLDATNLAYSQGVIMVAAAGNSNADVANFYPAALPHVITVAAWDGRITPGGRASFSNYGSGIDLIAPGVETLSLRATGTDMYLGAQGYVPGSRIVPACNDTSGNPNACPGNRYYRANGTSMAAPHVAGLMGLMTAVAPGLSVDLIEIFLPLLAEDVLTPGKDSDSGYGLINAEQAVTFINTMSQENRPELLIEEATAVLDVSTNVNLDVTVANVGLANASEFRLTVFNGNSSSGTVLNDSSLNLAAGSRQTLHFSYPLASAPALITIQVDPSNQVTEYVETNNEYRVMANLTFGGSTQIQARINSANRQQVDVTAVVRNTGRREAHDIRYRVYTPDVNGVILVDNTLAMVNPGAEATITTTLPLASVPQYKVAIRLDPLSTIPEYDEGDNDRLDISVEHAYLQGWPKSIMWLHDPELPEMPVYNTPALEDLDGDGDLDVVVGSTQFGFWTNPAPPLENYWHRGYLYAWDQSGTDLPGWPQAGNQVPASPLIADLDGDGTEEVIVMATKSRIYSGYSPGFVSGVYVYRRDGSLFPGWPQQTYPQGQAYIGSPAVGDIDPSYPGLEIVVGSRNEDIPSPTAAVFAWHSDGTAVPGWPSVNIGPMSGGGGNSPILADIDPVYPGLEVITVGGDGYNDRLYAWRGNGTTVPGWESPAGCGFGKFSSPAIGDVDHDGLKDLVLISGASVCRWRSDGTLGGGWWLGGGLGGFGYGPAVLADLNGDSNLETIVSTEGSLYVLTPDGQFLPGWPKNFERQYWTNVIPTPSPTVADLDGDGIPEIIVAKQYKVFAFHRDGSAVLGFPLTHNADDGTVISSVTVADLQGDGTMELALAPWLGPISVWTMPWNSSVARSPWPTFQHDNQRTGKYSPPASTIPACIMLLPGANDTFTSVGTAYQPFTMTLRDASGAAIPNMPVTLDFTQATDLKLATVQSPGVTVDCLGRTIQASTNSNGVLTLNVRGAGTLNSSQANGPGSVDTVKVYANGVLLKNITATTPDLNGAGSGPNGIDPTDGSLLLTDISTHSTTAGRSNLNCSAAPAVADGVDASIWISYNLSDNASHAPQTTTYCPTYVTPRDGGGRHNPCREGTKRCPAPDMELQ